MESLPRATVGQSGMKDSRGLTLIEILLAVFMIGTIVAALISRSWRPFRFLLAVYGVLFALLTLLAVVLAWRLRISLPLQLRALDRLERDASSGPEAIAAIARFRGLLHWLPLDRSLKALQVRIEREGPFRREYLRLLETYLWSERAREMLRSVADGGGPLASDARDILRDWSTRQEA